MPTYRIDVHTGSRSTTSPASSAAKVYVTLFGTRASSDELDLTPGAFARGGMDTFERRMAHLGELQRIRVRHDNAGIGPAWFLDQIAVHEKDSGRSWTFPCGRWLARHEDDGEIERMLDTA